MDNGKTPYPTRKPARPLHFENVRNTIMFGNSVIKGSDDSPVNS
jgi:hypothetical protein